MRNILFILCFFLSVFLIFNCSFQEEEELESQKTEEIKTLSIQETDSNAIFVENDTLGLVLFKRTELK